MFVFSEGALFLLSLPNLLVSLGSLSGYTLVYCWNVYGERAFHYFLIIPPPRRHKSRLFFLKGTLLDGEEYEREEYERKETDLYEGSHFIPQQKTPIF